MLHLQSKVQQLKIHGQFKVWRPISNLLQTWRGTNRGDLQCVRLISEKMEKNAQKHEEELGPRGGCKGRTRGKEFCEAKEEGREARGIWENSKKTCVQEEIKVNGWGEPVKTTNSNVKLFSCRFWRCKSSQTNRRKPSFRLLWLFILETRIDLLWCNLSWTSRRSDGWPSPIQEVSTNDPWTCHGRAPSSHRGESYRVWT